MKSQKIALLLTFCIVLGSSLILGSCGGRGDPSTGLDREALLVNLEHQNIGLLCTWAVEVTDGLLCQDGENLEGFTAYDCTEDYTHLPSGCGATVGHFEDCTLLLRACGSDAKQVLAACEPLITCFADE